MSWLGSTELKVGLLVITAAAIFAGLSMKISENGSIFGGAQKYWFVVHNAGGLVKNSAVRMAGIRVGVVRDITLVHGKARVDLTLGSGILLTSTARVEIRSDGILGDKHVEIVNGSELDSPLEPGGQIIIVATDGSLDTVMQEVSKMVKSLSKVSEQIQTAFSEDGDLSHPAGRIVRNIEKLTENLSGLVEEKRGKVSEIIDQIHGVTRTLDEVLNDEGEEGFRATWKGLSASLKRVESALKNVDEITEKINKGEGTIGRLVNDEKTVEELNTALEGVNEFIDAGSRLETRLDFRSEFLAQQNLTKSYLGVRIQPGLDRYYELQVVDDPKGVIERVDTDLTTAVDTPGQSSSTTREVKTYFNKVKFTALFAKNFFNWTVKGGLIENTGGVGFDYHLFRKKVRLSVEAFDFGSTNLRSSVTYNFFKGFYVVGGADDILSDTGDFSSYLGAGLSLTNDDLKMFASKVSF